MTDRRTAGAFAGCAVLAGGNAVCVRLSNRELTPLWGAGLRFALAAVLLWGLVRLWRVPLPQGRALMGSVAYGLLNFAAAFALAYVGLVRASAGSAGALLALVPLATLTLAVVHGQEHVRGPAVIGGVLAVLGVGVVSKASLDQAVPALSVLALLGAVVCMAEATVMARRFPDVHPIAANAIGMTAAAAVLIAGSAAVEGADSLVLPQLGATWFALLYLVPAGSVGVFVLFLVVVTHMEASRAAYVDVLIPIITGALAAWILDEPLGAELALGGVLILVGVYLGALHPASPKGGQVSAAVGECDELASTGAGGM